MAEATIGARLLIRLLLVQTAVWSLVAGIVLVGFQGAGADALGAGVADEPGQRLAGAHLLVLAPAYVLMAWHTDRYNGLLWLPIAAQFAVVLAVGYSIVNGATDFEDGVIAAVVSGMLGLLLAFAWVTEQRGSTILPSDETDDEKERNGAESHR
jgi:hypothetical protein